MKLYTDTILINFLILKLGGIVDWSWWVIFSPILVLIVVNLILIFFSLEVPRK